MAINYQKLFGDLGLIVRAANRYRGAFADAIDAEAALKAAESANGRYEIAGDGGGQLTAWRLSGATPGGNTDGEGKLHVSLTAAAGTATVALYKAAAKLAGDLVAQGTAPDTGTVSVILSAQNSSGLSGTVTLTYSADDMDITIIPPFRTAAHNRLFERLAQTDTAIRQTLVSWFDAEVASAADYIVRVVTEEIASTFTTVEEVIADLADRMTADAQSVDANAVSATTPVADPDNIGGGTLGAVAVDQMVRTQSFRVECVNADTTGAELWEVHASTDGLLPDRVTTGVAYASALGGVSFTISASGADFAVGDIFTFDTTSSEEGTLQSFFRDAFAAALPANATSAETINDALAE